MKVAVASGKGGTGKTTVAVSLASALSASETSAGVTFIDCDVEAPNAYLFLNPEIGVTGEVRVMIPAVDESKCTGCGECSRVCQFNALAVLGKNVILFPELCHGCGGCALVCEPKAITESSRLVGNMEWGRAGDIGFYHGRLRVGEPMSPPLIHALKKKALAGTSGDVILDCPPGSTCPMIEAVRGSDYCLMVTEPTPFGLHDLEMAAAAVRELGIPAGVVLNRANMGDGVIGDFCQEHGLELLLEIPHSREIAEAYASGRGLDSSLPGIAGQMRETWTRIAKEVAP